MASFRALLIAALMASVAAFVPRAPMLARGPARFASRSGPVMMARMTQKQRALKYPNAGKVHIVLTADVPGQGQKGDLLWTTRGFLLNKLLPQGLAKNATPAMVKQAEEQKAAALAEYEAMKEKMSGIASSVMARGPFKVSKRVGENDAIFGSVTTSQVLDLMRSEYADVPEKCDVNLPEIKKLGTYPVSVQLHPEVMTTVQLEVVAE